MSSLFVWCESSHADISEFEVASNEYRLEKAEYNVFAQMYQFQKFHSALICLSTYVKQPSGLDTERLWRIAMKLRSIFSNQRVLYILCEMVNFAKYFVCYWGLFLP